MARDDRLHEVRGALAEVWDTQGRQFATFEAEAGEDLWIQYLDGELNVRWPLEEDPRTALPRLGAPLPATAFVGFWAAGENAVLEVGDALLDDVAGLVVRIFDRVLLSSPGLPFTSRVDAHS